MVREGVDVQVVDAATGEDLTRLVLTQIIVEDVKAPNSGFPLDVLKQMVVASGHVSRETAVRYTKAMFDVYQGAYRDFMQNMMGIPPSAPPQPQPPAGDQKIIDELRKRIDEQEQRVSRRPAKKAPRRRS